MAAGLAFTTGPATDAIMGALPAGKAGAGLRRQRHHPRGRRHARRRDRRLGAQLRLRRARPARSGLARRVRLDRAAGRAVGGGGHERGRPVPGAAAGRRAQRGQLGVHGGPAPRIVRGRLHGGGRRAGGAGVPAGPRGGRRRRCRRCGWCGWPEPPEKTHQSIERTRPTLPAPLLPSRRSRRDRAWRAWRARTAAQRQRFLLLSDQMRGSTRIVDRCVHRGVHNDPLSLLSVRRGRALPENRLGSEHCGHVLLEYATTSGRRAGRVAAGDARTGPT